MISGPWAHELEDAVHHGVRGPAPRGLTRPDGGKDDTTEHSQDQRRPDDDHSGIGQEPGCRHVHRPGRGSLLGPFPPADLALWAVFRYGVVHV